MVRGRGRRRRWVGAAVVVAAALAWSSAAWACVIFFGKMTITGNAGPGMVTVIGNQQSGWCPSYPLGKAKASRGGSITLWVKSAGPDTCVAPDSRLPQGTYDVNYYNSEPDNPATLFTNESLRRGFVRSDPKDKSNADGSRDWQTDCMGDAPSAVPDTDPPPSHVRIGTLEVDSSGKGKGTFGIPASGVASGPTDESAVCVSDSDGVYGLQAPLTIL